MTFLRFVTNTNLFSIESLLIELSRSKWKLWKHNSGTSLHPFSNNIMHNNVSKAPLLKLYTVTVHDFYDLNVWFLNVPIKLYSHYILTSIDTYRYRFIFICSNQQFNYYLLNRNELRS